jgi:hypothetical protein
VAWAAAAIALVLGAAGCSGGGRASSAPSTGRPTPDSTATITLPTSAITDAPSPTDDAVSHVLEASFTIPEYGDGFGTGCAIESTPDSGPTLRLDDVFGSPQLGLGTIVALCVGGFARDQAITVTSSVGSERHVTVFIPTDGRPSKLYPGSACAGTDPSAECQEPEEYPNLLFDDGAERPIYPATLPDGQLLPDTWITNDWWFIPEDATGLLRAGGFELTASQGQVSTAMHFTVGPAANGPAANGGHALYWLHAPGLAVPTMLVEGFEVGDRIPLGLYGPGDVDPAYPDDIRSWKLLRTIATVEMPATLLVLVQLPDDVRATAGTYAITPPLLEQIDTPQPIYILDGRPA